MTALSSTDAKVIRFLRFDALTVSAEGTVEVLEATAF
jgi:hypothetical protein